MSNERGAVLITVLALLLVMIVLAIGSVRTAALDLAMAGQAQYREQSSLLAESGIGASLSQLERDGPAGLPAAACEAMPDWGPPVTIDEVAGSYQTRACRSGSTVDYPGSPAGPYRQIHFRVESRGRAGRGAEAVHVQGYYVALLDPGQPPPDGAQAGQLVCVGADCYLVAGRLATRTFWHPAQPP
jgi:hypothetical protein